MPDVTDTVVAVFVMLAGAIVLSATGFGIGLVTTPFLLLIFDPQTVVVTINTVSAGLLAMVLVETRQHLDARTMTPVAVAGVLGVPVGVIVLSSLSPVALRIGINVLVILLTVFVALNIQLRVPKPRLTGPVLGFGVSTLVTGLAIGGPLMVLFLMNFNLPRQTIRAAMSFYYMSMAAAAIIGYFIAGLYTADRLVLIGAVIVPSIAGYRLAVVLVRRTNDRLFRRAVVAIIAITSMMVLGREVMAL